MLFFSNASFKWSIFLGFFLSFYQGIFVYSIILVLEGWLLDHFICYLASLELFFYSFQNYKLSVFFYEKMGKCFKNLILVLSLWCRKTTIFMKVVWNSVTIKIKSYFSLNFYFSILGQKYEVWFTFTCKPTLFVFFLASEKGPTREWLTS